MLMFQYPTKDSNPIIQYALTEIFFYKNSTIPTSVFLSASILSTIKKSVLTTTFLSNKSEFILKATQLQRLYKGQNNIFRV